MSAARFTDLVSVDAQGRVTLAKVASTPADQSLGVMEGLDRLAEALGIDPCHHARAHRAHRAWHDGGDQCAARAQGRQGRPADHGRPSRHHRDARGAQGRSLQFAPAAADAARAARTSAGCARAHAAGWSRRDRARSRLARRRRSRPSKRQRVEAIAICYLHSWRDASHERATAEAVRAAMPGVYVALSSDVLPQIKEYDRVCTTVVNAYVGPALERYLLRLETPLARGRVRRAGADHPVTRRRRQHRRSGAAGRRQRALRSGRRRCRQPVCRASSTGTATSFPSIWAEPRPISPWWSAARQPSRSDRRIAGQRVALQSLDIASIGAGGGSIARVDHSGVLHVGPESAGAQPGPACYGGGGIEATVTDASLVLGFLDPDNFLGGAIAA